MQERSVRYVCLMMNIAFCLKTAPVAYFTFLHLSSLSTYSEYDPGSFTWEMSDILLQSMSTGIS